MLPHLQKKQVLAVSDPESRYRDLRLLEMAHEKKVGVDNEVLLEV